MSKYKHHILTNRAVVIIFDDRTVTVSANQEKYHILRAVLKRGDYGDLDKMTEVEMKKQVSGSNKENKKAVLAVTLGKGKTVISKKAVKTATKSSKANKGKDVKAASKCPKAKCPESKCSKVDKNKVAKIAGEHSNRAVVSVGYRNRINIPVGLLVAAGITPNKQVRCFCSEKTKQLMLVVTNKDLRVIPTFQGQTYVVWKIAGDYSVYNDGGLKVGHNILSEAGLGKVSKLVVSVEARGVLRVTKIK